MSLLMLLAVAAQAPLLFGWTTPLRPSGESAVNADIVMPALADAAAVLQAGDWPWWNPFARLGEPFIASGVQPLYPGYWPILFGGARALPWVLVLHSVLACVLMFRWLRSLPASRFSAFLGAGSYGAGVFFQMQLLRLPDAAAAAWLPLALEGVWRLTRPGRRAPYVAVAALGFAAMFVTGSRAVPWLGVVAGVLLAALNLPRLPRSARVPVVAHLGLVALATLLLAAPVWLEQWQLADSLSRGDIRPTATLMSHTMAIAAATPLPATQLAIGRAGADVLEFALFPGTIVLLMLALALLRPSPAQPRWPWLALAALGLMIATDGPWSDLLHDQLALDGARPGASLVLLQLGVLVLASLGLDGFLERPFKRTGAILGIGGVAVAAGSAGLLLAITRPPALQTWLASTSLAGDNPALASIVDAFVVALAPTAAGLTLLGAALLFWRRLGVLRLKVMIASIAFVELLYLAWATAPSRATPTTFDIIGADDARVLATDATSLDRLHRGRAPVQRVNRSGDAVLSRTQEFLDEAMPGALRAGARVCGATPTAALFTPQLAALAQIDVLLGDTPMHTAMPAGPDGKPPAPSPWARLVFEARHFDTTIAARRALAALPRPTERVILETKPSEFVPRAPHRPAAVKVLERQAQHARLQVDVGQGRGYLVIADAFAPGWRATLDGEPVPLLPADVAFRAIAIPEGEHEVVLRYAPWAKRFGLPMTALGAVLCLLWLGLARRRR